MSTAGGQIWDIIRAVSEVATVHLKTLSFVIGVMLCVSQPSIVQSDSCRTRTVPVNVLTEKGEIVSEIRPESFRASFDHKPVRILSVIPNQMPTRLMIMLDASGSMTHGFRRYVGVAVALVESMPPESLIGLVVFSEKIKEIVPLTNDREKLNDELTRLQGGDHAPRGHTALWDALLAVASSQFEIPQNGDAIYAITDGQDNSSKMTVSNLERVLLQKQLRLFLFIYMDPKTAPMELQMEFASDIRELAVKTGGYGVALSTDIPYIPPGENKTLRVQFQHIFAFDLLKVELPERFEKNRDWNLEPRGEIRHDFITYPHKLAACPSAATR